MKNCIFMLSVFTIGALAASTTPQGQAEIAAAAVPLVARGQKAGFVKKRHVRRFGNDKPLNKRCKSSGSGEGSSATTSAMDAYQTVASTVAASNSSSSTASDSSDAQEAADDSNSQGSDNSNNSKSNSGSNSNSNSNSGSSSSSGGLLSGLTQFLGKNSGIGSWFRTDNGGDDTNGRSWCQLNYQDSWMGFAPSVDAMLGNFGNDITKAGTAYCGLEVKATNPNNGNSALIYIVDGFDQQWVRTPGSVDLTLAAFKALYGSDTTDKDIVIQGLQWEFTGNRNPSYAFNAGS